MGANKWVIGGVAVAGLGTIIYLVTRYKPAAALPGATGSTAAGSVPAPQTNTVAIPETNGNTDVTEEPNTGAPVTPNETVATTNTPATIVNIPSTSFIGVSTSGETIDTNTTPVSTTYSKYAVGDQLTYANSDPQGLVYTITAIQAGYYVMSYQGGGPLTIQCDKVDNNSLWIPYTDIMAATPAVAAVAASLVATSSPTPAPAIIPSPLEAPDQNGEVQINTTPAPPDGSIGAGSGGSTETIITYGLGTDSPYQIINGQIVYI
jgi:hypothetical protein